MWQTLEIIYVKILYKLQAIKLIALVEIVKNICRLHIALLFGGAEKKEGNLEIQILLLTNFFHPCIC